MTKPPRIHYMDNLRALAMLAGVVFHASLAYSPLMQPFFPTADRDNAAIVDVFAWFMHLFRMPLFFLIAGFFAALLVHKGGLPGLFRNRLRRILIPFVLFLPLVHLALSRSTLWAAQAVEHPSPMLILISEFMAMENPPSLPPGTGHLWFLYYLVLFYVLLWVIRSLEWRWPFKPMHQLHPGWVLGLAPLMLLPFFAAVSAPHPAPESLLPQFWALGLFGAFFGFGYLLHGQPTLIARQTRYAPWLTLASVALYGVFLYLLSHNPPGLDQPRATLGLALTAACISVWMTSVCLSAGIRWLDRSNAVLSFLSHAAFWTYLIHLPLLFAIQYLIMDLDWVWPAKFAFSSLVTLAVCLLSYPILVSRTPLARLLGPGSADLQPKIVAVPQHHAS